MSPSSRPLPAPHACSHRYICLIPSSISDSLRPEEREILSFIWNFSDYKEPQDLSQPSSYHSQGHCSHQRTRTGGSVSPAWGISWGLSVFLVSNPGKHPLQGSIRALLRSGICRAQQPFLSEPLREESPRWGFCFRLPLALIPTLSQAGGAILGKSAL